MEKKANFRVKVMKHAWVLFRATKQAWRVCMLKAWQLYRLAKRMKDGVVSFAYRKTDGSIREASGTLKDIPTTEGKGKRSAAPNFKTFAYFDTDKHSFRCFKVENLIGAM